MLPEEYYQIVDSGSIKWRESAEKKNSLDYQWKIVWKLCQ